MDQDKIIKAAPFLFFIPFEGLFFLLGLPVQSFSLFAALTMVTLLYWFDKITKTPKTPILVILFILYSYLLLISMINIMIYPEQVEFFIRQFVSLTIGITEFLFLRYIFIVSTEKSILKYSLLGFYSVTIFSILDILNRKYRIQSLFTEPSHLGQYLVFVILPLLLVYRKNMSRLHLLFVLSLILIQLVLTYSSTAFIKLILLLIGFLFLSSKISVSNKVFILIVSAAFTFGMYYYLFELDIDNYMQRVITESLSAESIEDMPLTVIDRLILLYILSNFHINIGSFFGYGLGGEAINYTKFLTPDISSLILSVKEFGFSINSFYAKILVNGGMIALSLYIWLIYITFMSIKKVQGDNILKSVLFAIFSYMLIGMANFSMIEIWFWIAFVDAEYVKFKKSL